MGRILALITNMVDKQAIQNITEQRCGIFSDLGIYTYHVGLDNIVCDNKVHRVFTNGVEYNKTLHDKMYYFYPRLGMNCLASLWATSKVYVISQPDNCKDYKRRFICLDQATNGDSTEVAVKLKRSKRSEIALSENGSNSQQSLFMMMHLFFVCFVTIGSCFLLVANRTLRGKCKILNKKVSILTTENESLKRSQI